MKEVCRFCSNDCRADPIDINGIAITSSGLIVLCVNWSCMWGRRAGKNAAKHGEMIQITLYDGTQTEAARFGTVEKPTANPGRFERLATKTGQIISKNAKGEYFYTGQNVFQPLR